MKKMNNKGFMLTETLIVSVFLVTTLMFLYIQFNNVKRSYDDAFKYNTVNDLYATRNIVDYIKKENIDKMKQELENAYYLDITSCPNTYFEKVEYCQLLFTDLKVKTVLFTKVNLYELRQNSSNLKSDMRTFLNYLNANSGSGYRLVVAFDDDTFASLKINEG